MDAVGADASEALGPAAAAAPSTTTTGTQTFINSITQGYGDDKLTLKHREALGHQPVIKLPRNVVKKCGEEMWVGYSQSKKNGCTEVFRGLF